MRLQFLSGLRTTIALRGARLPSHIQGRGALRSVLPYSSQADAVAARGQDDGPAVASWGKPYNSQAEEVAGPIQDKESVMAWPGINSRRGVTQVKTVAAKSGVTKRTSRKSAKSRKAAKQQAEIPAQQDSPSIDSATLILPTHEEVPYFPSDLLSRPFDMLRNRLSAAKSSKATFARCTSEKIAGKKNVNDQWKAKGSVAIPGHGTFEAVAIDSSIRNAEKVCGLRIIAEMHSKGLIKELWPLDIKGGHKTENDALEDVYNYCATHMAIPEVTVEHFTPILPQDKKSLVRCTISMAEQDIHISAVGNEYRVAEVAAARKFKSAAEAYVASSGTSDRLVVKVALHLENAEMFHQWVKSVNQNYDYKVDSTTVGSTNKAQLFIRNGTQWKETGTTIEASSKLAGERIVLLRAAIAQMQANPLLQEEFLAALRQGNGKILRKASPLDLELPTESLGLMRQTLSYARVARLDTKVDIDTAAETEENRRGGRPSLWEPEKKRISEALYKNYQQYLNDDGMAAMRKIKSELPMNHYKDQVFRIVEDNEYSIIIGATGSGKTTQVPQIILEQYYQNGNGADCEILCTQPRRIAATSVSRRVKDEMGPSLSAHVGHHVRFDTQLPRQGGSVTYCTTGILLQQLQTDPERIFDQVSHIILDEVHERDKIIDFTLTILKKVITERLVAGKKCPKITLMSATLDTELFANYFKNSAYGVEVNAPVLSVPGRTFPVNETYMDDIVDDLRKNYSRGDLNIVTYDKATMDYLEDEERFATSHVTKPGSTRQSGEEAVIDWKTKQTYNNGAQVSSSPEEALIPYGLVAATIAHVAKVTTEGAILVFFPGLQEMQKVEKLMQNPIFGVDLLDTTKYKSFLLHSSIPDTQKSVFEPVPPGTRKIILSSNIAETSITIPDVQHVIDTGKLRELRYDHVKRISSLDTTWISKSNAKQRAGRAGRVQNGNYYALYSRARSDSLKAIGLPEILRSDLQATCLSVKSSIRGADIREFLAGAIEPPSPAGVDEAVRNLVDMGAFTTSEDLTTLGKVLASLPIHPALGKMILLGVLFKCLDPILVIGAAAEERGLWVMAPGSRDETLEHKRSFMQETGSEHLSLYNAFSAVREYHDHGQGYDREAVTFAYRKNIHFGAWKAIYSSAKQMEQILKEQGLIPKSSDTTREMFGGASLNVNSHKAHVVKAILFAGLMPNMALSTSWSDRPWRTTIEDTVMLPKTSVVHAAFPTSDSGRHNPRFIATYSNLAKGADGKSTFLRDVSVVDPLTAALFATSLTQTNTNVVEACGWLPLFIKAPGFLARQELTKAIIEMRWVLECLQSNAFANLTKGMPMHGIDKTSHERETVIDRTVDVLDLVAHYRDPNSVAHPRFNQQSSPRHYVNHDNFDTEFDNHVFSESFQRARPSVNRPSFLKNNSNIWKDIAFEASLNSKDNAASRIFNNIDTPAAALSSRGDKNYRGSSPYGRTSSNTYSNTTDTRNKSAGRWREPEPERSERKGSSGDRYDPRIWDWFGA